MNPGTDAVAWVEAFMKDAQNTPVSQILEHHHLLMWFAHAIAAGRTAGYAQAKREDGIQPWAPGGAPDLGRAEAEALRVLGDFYAGQEPRSDD